LRQGLAEGWPVTYNSLALAYLTAVITGMSQHIQLPFVFNGVITKSSCDDKLVIKQL
jgi:hypothetical protein